MPTYLSKGPAAAVRDDRRSGNEVRQRISELSKGGSVQRRKSTALYFSKGVEGVAAAIADVGQSHIERRQLAKATLATRVV